MIVDVHTHTPTHRDAVPDRDRVENAAFRPDRVVATTTTWGDFAHAADEAGVDVSIVFNIAVRSPIDLTGLPSDPARINDSTAEFAAAQPTRRIGFMSIHPEEPGALEELERCVGDLGLRGIKLGPNYHNFDPLGAHAHPLVMDEIAIRHPELRIVMAHLGHPWQADTIAVIRKHPHVFADVSAGFYRPWSFYSAMCLATEWNVLEKLVFGSD